MLQMDVLKGLKGALSSPQAMPGDDKRSVARATANILQAGMPSMASALVSDRDKHMVDVALRVPHKRMVMVCGLIHMDGIEREWAKRN